MLHTDFFNKNNKHKMQKPDYVKNTSRAIANEGLSNEILEVWSFHEARSKSIQLILIVFLPQHYLHSFYPHGR